jgi:hypothetical protein
LKNSPSGYTKLLEKYSAVNDVDLYYLTHTDLTYLNKKTWNTLFEDNFTDTTMKVTFQTALDTVDALIYDENSDYVVILSQIHHHLLHPDGDNDDNQNGVEELAEIAYYTTNADELSADMTTIKLAVDTVSSTTKNVGLDELYKKKYIVTQNTMKSNKFLSTKMVENMVEFRNLYISIRSEIYDKIINA